MIIKNSEEMIIDDYLKSNSQLKQYFIESSEQIKQQISKNIAYKICEEVYDTKNCVTPNEKDVQEKITNIMDEVIDDFYKEIDVYVKLQYETIDKATTRISDNELEFDQPMVLNNLTNSVNCSEIQLSQEINYKIIERVNSHVAFRNQMNPEYYKLKSGIENYVRQETPGKIDLFKEEIDKLYEDTLNKLNNLRQKFYDSVSSFNKVEKNTISQNEAAFIDKPGRTLDPNAIFGEYESENAKRFL